MADRNAGYDQSRDPRTGRPPLAADAERIKAERIKQLESHAPEGQQEAAVDHDENAAPSEEAITVEETDSATEFHEQRSTDGDQDDDDDEAAVEQAVDDLESTDDGSADDEANR